MDLENRGQEKLNTDEPIISVLMPMASLKWEKFYDAKVNDKKWQDFWKDRKIYKFKMGDKEWTYSIDTPPPTVSGKIHIGHVFSYTQIDILARFKQMNGFDVFYPFGFDDNGLPTERLVEKENNIRARDLPREEFVKLCLATTRRYEEEFENLFQSLGFSIDWDLCYSTVNRDSQKTSQKSFIDLYNKGKAYHADMPSHWCAECQTSIAQAELETKKMDTIFNYVNFGLEDSEENLMIATTRPELLGGCVAVFVNPKDEKYSKLVGKKAIVPLFNNKVPIIADERVGIEKGTGAVMCCTFGDSTDLEWWKEYKLPTVSVINKFGKIKEGQPYEGLKINQAREKVIEDLNESGLLVKQEKISHDVNVHERCGKPTELIPTTQWFVDLMSNKQNFIDAGEKIKWHPEYMKQRYMDWVKNLKWDWNISRQRYFGVPIPVWYCKDCGEVKLPEEYQLPVNPINDKPIGKCTCGCKEFIPETDVLDTWATSSVTPQINTKWAEKGHEFNNLSPMSLRPNAHDIIRTWDFYSIVKSLYHTSEIPWKDIMISGHVLAGKNEKISKSKNNAQDSPESLIDTYSADAIRLWTASGKLGNDVVFSKDELKNGRRLINKLWNAGKFGASNLQDYEKEDNLELLPVDKWILSRMESTREEVIRYLEDYEVSLALNTLEQFFWTDLCDNYLEIIKDRINKPELHGENNRKSGQQALYNSLYGTVKMFAPFIPHVTEEIYQQFFKKYEKKESVHLTNWKEENIGYKDSKLESLGNDLLYVLSQIRKYKTENRLSYSALIEEVTIKGSKELIDFLRTAEKDILALANSKTIKFLTSSDEKVEVHVNLKEVHDEIY